MNQFPILNTYRRLYYLLGKLILIGSVIAAFILFFDTSILSLADVFISGGYYYYDGNAPTIPLGLRFVVSGAVLLGGLVLSSFITIVAEGFSLVLRVEDYLRTIRNDQQRIAALSEPDVYYEVDVDGMGMQGAVNELRDFLTFWKNQLPSAMQQQLASSVQGMLADQSSGKPPAPPKINSPQPSTIPPVVTDGEPPRDSVKLNAVVRTTELNVCDAPFGKAVRTVERGRKAQLVARTGDCQWVKVEATRTLWVQTSGLKIEGNVESLPVIQ
jgi:hypothetical protein